MTVKQDSRNSNDVKGVSHNSGPKDAKMTGKPEEEFPVGYNKDDTLFIFDWDDTILPTTWVIELGFLLCGLE